MKKSLLLMLIPLLAAAAEPESRISRVTVYPGMALIERQVSLELLAGTNRPAITGLPAGLVDESVHARLGGSPGVTLQELTVEKWFRTAAGEGEHRQLAEELRDLERRLKLVEGEINALAAQERFILSIQAAAAPAAGSAVTLLRPDPAVWSSTLTFIGSNLNRIYEARTAKESVQRQLQEEKEALEAQLAEAQPAKPREDKSIALVLEAAEPVTARLTLTYLVTGVTWWPSYEIRALPAEGRLEIRYHGHVRQTTGEDWRGVELALSTARPESGAAAPEAKPWDLRLWQPRAVRMEKANAVQMAMAPMADEAAAAAPPAAAPAFAEVETRSASALFVISGSRDLPSGEEPVKVTIRELASTTAITCITLPKYNPAVFLQAQLRNETLFPLLEGPAMIYVDGDFNGKGVLKALAPGESAEISLGIDAGVKVKRELVKKYERGKGTLNKKREMAYEYRIVVENFKKEAVQLRIVDQLPRPLQEEIEVRDVRLNPEPGSRDPQTEQLTWTIELGPGEKRELLEQFAVAWPNDAAVIGLE